MSKPTLTLMCDLNSLSSSSSTMQQQHKQRHLSESVLLVLSRLSKWLGEGFVPAPSHVTVLRKCR
jgi:hypothetical protein